MKKSSLVLASILVVNLMVAQQIVTSFGQPSSSPRQVSMDVKVVFVGLDSKWIDLEYMSWEENLPLTGTNQIVASGNDTGVVYQLSYSYSFASSEFKDRYVKYLKTIETVVTSKNPWFYYWKEEGDVWTQVYKDVKNTLYDANKVESWLYENRADFGGFPENGWTFIISYLPELPSTSYDQYKGFWNDMDRRETSTPHYYSVSYADADLGYKPQYQEFMTGWGARNRFWYLDLSAGPARWYDARWDLPLQVVLKDMGLDLQTAYGKKWFTEYLADYLWGMIYNFAIPQFLYDPILTSKYGLAVYVLDNRTREEKSAVPIESTVDAERIRAAFKDLTPYIETQVQVTFKDTEEYPELLKLLVDHYKYLDSWTYAHVFDDPQRYASIDLRPVYSYLQDNLASFVPRVSHDENEVTIPVFAFALSEETYFTYSYKWFIDRLDPETGALWGVALGDMVIVGLCQHDFRRGDEAKVKQPGKGYGLTQTIIHEVGHMVGLMHPHSYDWVGDFSLSAMSYYTYDYVFGQHDKDALQRIHADKIMMETASMTQDTQIMLQTKVASPDVEGVLSKAQDLLKQADSEYSKMNYATAVEKALEARESAKSGFSKARDLPSATAPLEERIQSLEQEKESLQAQLDSMRATFLIYAAVGVAAGLAIGCAVTWVMLRRKPAVKET